MEQFYRTKLRKTMQQVPGGTDYLDTRGLEAETAGTKAKKVKEAEDNKKLAPLFEDAAKRYPNDPEKQKRYIDFIKNRNK